jgi:hypothetical protein
LMKDIPFWNIGKINSPRGSIASCFIDGRARHGTTRFPGRVETLTEN